MRRTELLQKIRKIRPAPRPRRAYLFTNGPPYGITSQPVMV
jgi:hypothetical protein